VASLARPSTRIFVEQTVARIERFRSDVRWQLFSHPPSPDDLAGVDVWIDPAVRADDFDGWAAESLVLGLPVVTSRMPINLQRLEQGRTGLLVPPGDPNELTHAILATLFKREVAEGKQRAARQTVSKFRARPRLRRLTELLEALNS
jgi:glycosyltransferase involved in cell wall biosynthesis